MGKNSKIEWTSHTFNPWWGCVKVSPACKHCYAEVWSRRVGQKLWGPDSPRRFFTDRHWSEPRKWDAEARQAGERRRVFCASMADVMEARDELDPWRARLWGLIADTPNLDWLLLTKRPQNVGTMVPWKSSWPANVWLGTTVENQKRARERLSELALYPAAVRFISAEPLLGPLDLTPWLGTTVQWVITGGESGSKARPTSPSWFQALQSQCRKSNVPFHFKQWGDWAPADIASNTNCRIVYAADGTMMEKIGKKNAGRVLCGKTWDELPRLG